MSEKKEAEKLDNFLATYILLQKLLGKKHLQHKEVIAMYAPRHVEEFVMEIIQAKFVY